MTTHITRRRVTYAATVVSWLAAVGCTLHALITDHAGDSRVCAAAFTIVAAMLTIISVQVTLTPSLERAYEVGHSHGETSPVRQPEVRASGGDVHRSAAVIPMVRR